jgi:hypothetical protein
MFSWLGGRTLDGAWGSTEAWSRSRLHNAFYLHERAPVTVMRMIGGLLHTEDWRETDVAPFHDTTPFLTGFGAEDGGHSIL